MDQNVSDGAELYEKNCAFMRSREVTHLRAHGVTVLAIPEDTASVVMSFSEAIGDWLIILGIASWDNLDRIIGKGLAGVKEVLIPVCYQNHMAPGCGKCAHELSVEMLPVSIREEIRISNVVCQPAGAEPARIVGVVRPIATRTTDAYIVIRIVEIKSGVQFSGKNRIANILAGPPTPVAVGSKSADFATLQNGGFTITKTGKREVAPPGEGPVEGFQMFEEAAQ
jgi:hypothetical protein